MTDQAAQLQQELEKYAPDVKWNVTPYDKFSILIMWEREISERRLIGEGEIDVALLKPGIEKVAQAIADSVSCIQPTGENTGPRLAYFIQDTHKAPDGGHIVCIAEEGTKGFASTDWDYGADKSAAQAAIDSLNKRLGMTRTEAFKIVSGSMTD